MLPVHFTVDPGLSWNGIDYIDSEEPDTLLHRYLDMQMIAVPGAEAASASSNDSCVNSEVQAPAMPAKADSWSELALAVADDAEETGCANFGLIHHSRRKGSTREKKVSGADCEAGSKSSTLSRNKLPIKMQSMARSFGSLGRSFRRLRKNITRIARLGAVKHNDKSAPVAIAAEHGHSGTTSVSSNHSGVLCAGLLHRRQPYQEEMVRNYLTNAAERFERECEKQQTSLVERLSSPAANDATVSVTVSAKTNCVNTGCKGTGDASTSYLCAVCFERQQQEEMGSVMPSHVVAPSGSVVGIATRVPVVSSSIAQMCSAEPESVRAAISSSSRNCYNGLSPSAAGIRHELDCDLDELQRSADRLPSVLTKTLTLRAE